MRLIHDECLHAMAQLPDKSVDMVMCDLPYGTTQNKWDICIDLEALWLQYKRLCTGAIVLTATQPFTSKLVCSNLKVFKHALMYEKSNATGHLNANRAPMRQHEEILVFSKGVYNPQMFEKPICNVRREKKGFQTLTPSYGGNNPNAPRTASNTLGFPRSIVRFNTSSTSVDKGLHPTQKPVALMEYLIRTYSNDGAIVLDNCMGSGTTGVACANTGRGFIGIELDKAYYKLAKARILKAEREVAKGGAH